MLVMTNCPDEFKYVKNAKIKWIAMNIDKPYHFFNRHGLDKTKY